MRIGDTWDAGYGAAGTQLSTLFVHPLLAPRDGFTEYDPDASMVEREGARSAILFGPPGTGKTTLVEAVAACLGWSFVEVTPALFLEKGVELVSARADEVFRQIMELDGCVILFDEIDELIRTRGQTADPLERFFTTTMLPRLSKLWNQRKVLFFVNTNGISEVDPAIRRSNRFDAAIFVLPPSFEAKISALDEQGVGVQLNRDRVYELLAGITGKVPENEHDLAWFALVRFDQISRLAARIRVKVDDQTQVTDADFASVLSEFGKELMSADWLDPSKKPGEMNRDLVIGRFRELEAEQRLDHGRRRVVETFIAGDPVEGAEVIRVPGNGQPGFWLIDVANGNLQAWAAEKDLELDGGGRLQPK